MKQNQSRAFGAVCRNRFEHGRNYARTRSQRLSGWGRVAHLTATPALALVLAARIARTVDAEERRDFLRALPATLTFLGAWAIGEAAGYATHAARASYAGTP